MSGVSVSECPSGEEIQAGSLSPQSGQEIIGDIFKAAPVGQTVARKKLPGDGGLGYIRKWQGPLLNQGLRIQSLCR